MPIPMNPNPESAALIGGAWPEYDESTYRADAEVQRKLSGTAEDGANVTRKVGDRTSDFKGAAGTALQDALSRDRSQLTTQQSVHHATASKLENLASAIENHKHNLNAIDESYHAQKATLIASGADPADLAQLQAQAQTYVGTAQSTFGAAYEGMVDTLLADADAAEGKPKPAPGGVELAEFKDGEPGSASGDADKKDDASADAPNDIDSGSDGKAEDKSEAAPMTESDTSEGAATESAPAVEDKAGTAAPVPAAPAPATPVAPVAPSAPAAPSAPPVAGGVGGVGAVPAAPAAAAGSTQAKDMGYATGQAATQFGAGLLSGLANQPAPGTAAAAPFGQTGYAPQAFGQGYPQQGYGQGFGGMPQAGAMNGYGQMNPAAFGQAAAAPLTEAGNAIGQFANQTANAMTGSDTGVAGLLGEALAGDPAGEAVPAAADGPATELKSQLIDTIDQYLDDPASSDMSGDDPAPDTAEDDTTVDAPNSDSDDASADTDSASSDSGDAEERTDAADEPSEAPAPVADPPAAPDTAPGPAGTPITANPTETVDPITRLQNGAGAAVDQIAMGLHGAIDGTADTARHLAGFPPVDASAPATHTSAGAAPSPATGLSANDFGHAPAAHSAPGVAAGGGAIGGAPQMMAPAAPAVAPAAGGPANLWTPPASAPTPPQTPLQPYGSGQPSPAHNNTGGAPPAGAGDGRINHIPTPPTAAAANAEAAVILSGLPASEVRAHQVLASLRKQQSVNEFVTPTAVGVFMRGDVAELIVATADGISYLPEGAGLPEGVRLITDFELPEGFYRHWSGYFSPVAKLAAMSKDVGHRVGTLTLALSSEPDRAQNEGVQSFVQTADQFLRLSNGGALAPTVRGRAQSAAQPSQEERQAVARLAAEQDIRTEDYNEWAAQVHGARWYNPEHADEYRMAWLRFLVCGALRAESDTTPDDAGLGYAIAELRRAVMAAPVGGTQ